MWGAGTRVGAGQVHRVIAARLAVPCFPAAPGCLGWHRAKATARNLLLPRQQTEGGGAAARASGGGLMGLEKAQGCSPA